MSTELTLLPPEPIKLLNEESNDDSGISNNEFFNTNDVVNQATDDSGKNPDFKFSKVFVGNATLVRGDGSGTKYIVWRITLILKLRGPVSDRTSDYITISPQIEIYKRYSEFVKFRKDLIDHLDFLKEQDLPDNLRRKLNNIIIPELPPKVPWYKLWEYYDINLNHEWLLKRRKGLEYFLNCIFLNRCTVGLCRDIIKSFIQTK